MTLAIIYSKASAGTVQPRMTAPTTSRAPVAPSPAPSAYVLKPAQTTPQTPVRTLTAQAQQAPAYGPKPQPQTPSYGSNQRQAPTPAPSCPTCPSCPEGAAPSSKVGLWMFLAGLAIGTVGTSAMVKRGA